MSRYDIAIIGMGCVYPNAKSTTEYWESIRRGDTHFKEMPKRLWHLSEYYSPDRNDPEKSYTKVGSFVEGFEFPFLEYKLPPANMRGIDPTQLMSIDATRQALEDAGIEPRSDQLTEAITIIGASGVDAFAHSAAFLKRHRFLKKIKPLLLERGVKASIVDRLDPEMTKELDDRGHIWAPSVAAVGAIPSSVSNRVAQVFGIRGMNMTVDAACASSFVALDVACQALMSNDCRIAVAGGADLGTNPPIYIGFSRVDGLSYKGMSNPFDHTADGLVIGEGVGAVVLKRVEDAIADGDHIKAVIRGIGASSDGAGQAIYAPSSEGRAESFRWGLQTAQTEHSEVQYIEAHATSTIVGDANEYDAISKVYGQNRKAPEPCYLGSVKAQIGHLKAAAGIAGLIKTVLAMEHHTIPHMPRFEKLTPGAKLPSEHLVINNDLMEWKPNADGKRVAAVTTSGFGGVNYHAILEQGDSYTAPERKKVSREVAIVGVQMRVAEADNVDTFWKNVTSGKDVFSRVDPADHGWEDCFETGPENEKIDTHVISKVQDYEINLLRHKIFPKAVSQIAPTQLLGLDLSDKLLDNNGFELAEYKKIGVSLGSMHDDYFPTIFPPMLVAEHVQAFKGLPAAREIDPEILEECCELTEKAIKEEFPPVTEHTLPGWMTNVTAGRIANRLNLHGPNFIVDSACSSGIAAIIPAMYQLMYGHVDMMISGGLNRQLSDTFTSGVCALGAVAKDVARPFDAAGEGYLIGEGGILFLLKRLEDARRDGDEIFGIIHAVGGSSEADSKSMIAPTESAMARAIRNALRQTSICPEEIGLSDTHGSANALSDIVEARALATELRPNGDTEPVHITAIKSHIGHLYGGSGAASMLSTIQALRTRTVPGIRLLENVRDEIAEVADRAVPRKGTIPMPQNMKAGGANSLGLGGANYFTVLTGPDYAPSGDGDDGKKSRGSTGPSRPMFRASDLEQDDIFLALTGSEDGYSEALTRALGQTPIPGIITEGSEVAFKLAITFDDQASLKNKLSSALKMLDGGHSIKPLESQGVFAAAVPGPGDPDGLVFCFPGQGVHYITMGRFLYDSEPAFRDVVDRVHELAMAEFEFDLLGHIYGPEDDEGNKERLGTLTGAQTSLFAVEVGMAKVLESRGIRPDYMIGHSFGEISALTAAGVWDLDTAYKAVVARIKAAHSIIDGGGPALGMMSLICSDEQLEAILGFVGEKVVLTNINAPGRFILAGEKEAVKRTVAMADSFGAEARLLPIGAAFHSQYMEPAKEPFRKALASLPCEQPRFPILSTITGEFIPQEGLDSEMLADHLSSQLTTPLNLPREIDTLYGEGARHFLEVGPGWSMTKMIGTILDDRDFRAAPTLHPKVGDVETFKRARAFLMALGHLDSAADRQNIPGMFSPDFLEYMESFEPAILALIEEVHGRFLDRARMGALPAPAPRRPAPAAATPATGPPPKTSAPAKAAPSAPTRKGGDPTVWIERLREKLVQTTGYPPEMLELDLDLEADLGVDSVQRAEIWVSLTTEHDLDSEARPTGARTIAQLAEVLAGMDGSPAGNGIVPETSVESDERAPEAAPAPTGGGDPAVWTERLREKLVQTTGYPPEMLELDLDLEADLGVDSVQRAEIWVSLTTEHDLDFEARPTGARTIAQLAEVLSGLEGPALGGAPAATADPAPAPEPAPAADSSEAAPAPTGGGDPVVWTERLREKLVQTTGYPPEMLELDLDLEADLGVDSVQRAEIWVSLTTEHDLDSEARPTGARTIAQLAEVLAQMDSASASTGTGAQKEDEAHEKKEPRKKPVPFDDTSACRLFVGGYEPVREEDLEPFECRRALVITANGDNTAPKIKRRLSKRGVEISTVRASTVAGMAPGDVRSIIDGCDTIIYVAHASLLGVPDEGAQMRAAFEEATRQLYSTFRAMVPVLAEESHRLIFPVSMDGMFGTMGSDSLLGAFPAGFVRSLARELVDCPFLLLDAGPEGWADAVDSAIDKIGTRLELGTSPYGHVVPNLAKLADSTEYEAVLEKGDLVLVTGGARGIVFECVYELAVETGCKLVLTGRTEPPEGKPEWLGTDPEDIDRVIREMEIGLVKSQGIKLPEAKRIGAKARSQWEVQRNLEKLAAAGIEASYETCDVSDPEAFGGLLDRIAAREPIRGIVHGAGVQKAKLAHELTDDAIALTIGVKLSPVFTMIDRIDWPRLRLLSGFGSIAGLFGNTGQTDYGFANDMLASMLCALGRKHPDLKVQTVEWTAWVGTGMVSEEEGKRFQQAGLTPLDVDTGVSLYMEAVTGCAHPRLSVFNSSASFASGRRTSPYPAAARPRTRLVNTDGGISTAHFSLDEDVYLSQHLVNMEPVVPGTFVTEILAEASEGTGLVPTDVQFRRPLQLRGDELEVEVIRKGDDMMILPAQRPDLEPKAMANLAYSTCRLAPAGGGGHDHLVISKKDYRTLLAQGEITGATFYDKLDSRFSSALKTGPVFRGIRSMMERGDTLHAAITITAEAASLLEVPGEFVFNPVLADMAVQVGAAWAMMRHDTMEIPFEIGAIHSAKVLADRDAVVICKAHSITEERTELDVAVREPEGDLVMVMDRLVLKTIMRGDE